MRNVIAICSLLLLLTGPDAWAERALSVQLTVSGTNGFNGFNGLDPASLTLGKGHLSGTLTVITVDGTYR